MTKVINMINVVHKLFQIQESSNLTQNATLRTNSQMAAMTQCSLQYVMHNGILDIHVSHRALRQTASCSPFPTRQWHYKARKHGTFGV